MHVSKYFYEFGKEKFEDRLGLYEDRNQYVTALNIKKFKEQLNDIKLDGKVAFLYAVGVGIHQSESREYHGDFTCSVEQNEGNVVIKSLTAYMMHQYAKILSKNNDINYVNINNNTCASSMHSIWEAESLLNSGRVDHVIIISEEKTSFNTIKIFKEHNIPLIVGEGFVCVVLSKESDGPEITDSKWEFELHNNPFLVTESGYSKVYTECDIVKGHSTGTATNTEAETKAFGEVAGYKHITGHTQGMSALLEVCMVLDDPDMIGRVLCVASGLGGFYGSCIVHK